jgi:hypothetical protein
MIGRCRGATAGRLAQAGAPDYEMRVIEIGKDLSIVTYLEQRDDKMTAVRHALAYSAARLTRKRTLPGIDGPGRDLVALDRARGPRVESGRAARPVLARDSK